MSCDRCGLTPYDGCKDGEISVNDITVRRCPNICVRDAVDSIHRRLGSEIASAANILESPFYRPRKDESTTSEVDCTTKNVRIRGTTWSEFLPHLKLVLVCHPTLTFKVVDDGRLRDVFVGGEAYRSTAVSKRDQRETHNVIRELVGQEFGLVILRLGHLGWKNVAASGVLEEALKIRETDNQPTWVFESCDPAYVWKHSHSTEVESYIESRYEEVHLTSELGVEVASGDIGLDSPETSEDLFVDVETAPVEHSSFVPETAQGSFGEPSDESDRLDVMLGGGSKRHKYRR